MDACWGILPSADGAIPNLNFGRISDDVFQQAMAEVLNNSDRPQPPATPVLVPETYFPAASGASNHATFGGHPLGSTSSGGTYGGFGFVAPENPHTCPTSSRVPHSIPLASPFASTPPEVHGCPTTWCNGVAPPKPSPTASDAVFATANSGVLNGELSRTSPRRYGHGSPATCSSPYDFVLGEEANQAGIPARHDFSFQYLLPSDQAPQHFPSYPNQAIPTAAFAPAGAQYVLPSRREFVQGPSSSAAPPVHLIPAVLAPHPSASTPYPLASGYDTNPTHVPTPFLPSSPSCIKGGYLSPAYGGMPVPGSSFAVPSVSPPILGKRKGEPTCSPAPAAKAAKLSAHTSPSRPPPEPEPEPTEEAKENCFPASSASVAPSTAAAESVPRTRLVWGIDWSQPQTWAGEPVAAQPSYRAVLRALSTKHGFTWDALLRCRWNGCTQAYARPGAMKAHVLGRAHLDVRRECLRCGYGVRPDNFKTRHTPAWCDKTLGRRERKARKRAERARNAEERALGRRER